MRTAGNTVAITYSMYDVKICLKQNKYSNFILHESIKKRFLKGKVSDFFNTNH
jgi:hypothetical protein